MTTDEIKAGLRRAVEAHILWGWYKVDARGYNEWIISPSARAPTVTHDDAGIIAWLDNLTTMELL